MARAKADVKEAASSEEKKTPTQPTMLEVTPKSSVLYGGKMLLKGKPVRLVRATAQALIDSGFAEKKS